VKDFKTFEMSLKQEQSAVEAALTEMPLGQLS